MASISITTIPAKAIEPISIPQPILEETKPSLPLPREQTKDIQEELKNATTLTITPNLSNDFCVPPKQTIPTLPSPESQIDTVPNIDETARYEGDKLDQEGPLTSNKSGQWETINFESSFELICAVDRHINSGDVTLHGWQLDVNKELSHTKATQHKPHRFALCAANGSGKDAYVIAPFVIFFALTKIRSLTIITSSSGVQLTAQTENYIASMAHAINNLFSERIFKITRRFIKCLKSGSEIRLFATDEEGKAEGYHPLEPNAEMLIIVNEAKSVAPEIFRALSRCTGYNFWLNVSTPGEPYGDFYDSFCNWPNNRRVNAFDCPHLSIDHINETKRKYGEQSAIYRSQILALFTAIGGMVVISQDYLNRCIERSNKNLIKWTSGKRKKIGGDFAAGRDECAFCCVDGNKQIDKEYFVEKDTTETEDKFEKFIRKHGARSIKLDGNYGDVDIFADDGGLGHAIIDRLVKKGYNITRKLNQSRAYDTKQFGNHGAENWFNLARLIEECLFILALDLTDKEGDNKIYEQLAYRHYKKQETQGKITLESKVEARANGHVSPDRADALVLALSDTNIEDIEKAIKDSDKKEAGFTVAQIQEQKWSHYRNAYLESEKKESLRGNSLESLFNLKGIH